jgi:hypothetical protein
VQGNYAANARLIAAAPDLLTALVEIYDAEKLDDDDPILQDARLKARQAIAKAKGECNETIERSEKGE